MSWAACGLLSPRTSRAGPAHRPGGICLGEAASRVRISVRSNRRREELRRVARRQDICRRAQRGRRRLGSVQRRAQLVRGAEVTKMSEKSRAHRPPRPTTARVKAPRDESQRTRVAGSLDAWLARDWTQALHVGSLEEFQQVQVCTQNTLYELIVMNRCGDVRVRGGRYFPEWTAARFAGQHRRRQLPQVPRDQPRFPDGVRARPPADHHLPRPHDCGPREGADRLNHVRGGA